MESGKKIEIFHFCRRSIKENINVTFFLFGFQTAIPVLIGTKFDDFAQLPLDVQWAIALQVSFSFLVTQINDPPQFQFGCSTFLFNPFKIYSFFFF